MRKWIGLALLFLLVGCNAEDATPLIEPNFSGEISGIETMMQQEERIQKRQLVAAENIVLVTYELKPAFRIQKQRVERELKKQLEEAYPSLQFVVSGDFKLHYEAQQLAKKERDDEEKSTEKSDQETNVKKAIEQLKKLAEEET